MIADLENLETRAAEAVASVRGAVIGAMEARRLDVTDEARARVSECDDPTVLQAWLIRALAATSAVEVFDG
jgi:hypothetical protein